MAVAFLLDIPGFTPEQSAAVLQELSLDKNPAAEALFVRLLLALRQLVFKLFRRYSALLKKASA